jgi:estrogen-related receptor beta like 1
MNEELSRNLERISRSEGQINSSMSSIGEQYKSQSEELKKLNIHYNNLSNSIKEMNENYRLVGEKLEQILSKTNEHSGSMTDSSPVVKIKDAYKVMLAEIKAMDVRMGVLSHTILQYKSK